MKSFRLHDRTIASIEGVIHRMNVVDDIITSFFTSRVKFIDDNIQCAMMSFGCISYDLTIHRMNVDDDICWKKYDSIDDNSMTD